MIDQLNNSILKLFPPKLTTQQNTETKKKLFFPTNKIKNTVDFAIKASATKHVSAPVDRPAPPSTGGLPPGQNICANCERLIV